MTWAYSAYGLDIRSALPLPELVESHGSADSGTARSGVTLPSESAHAHDVVIRMDYAAESFPSGIPDDIYTTATTTSATLSWRHVGTFRIRDGRDITVTPTPNVDPDTVRLFLLGPSLGVLIHQRGWAALHASAVEIGGRACVFAGGSGWGKSTMCAALHARGHGAIADDLTAIECSPDHTARVLPGFPRLKVWPDSATAVGHSVDALRPIRPGLTKRALVARTRFPARPLPLARIYVLTRGDDVAIKPISPARALLELATHAHGARLLRNADPAHHFKQYGRIANTVPIRHLARPWSLDRLDDVVRAIENDVERDA